MKKKIGYLGPAGTFCEQAARVVVSGDDGWELISCRSIDEVFAAVDSGQTAYGMVPVENSCEGSVNLTLDLLAYEYRLAISGEVILPVRHNLLARPGVGLEDISCVFSHGQALAQCRKYLLNHLPGADLVEMPSTAEAACRVSSSGQPWAAIGTGAAAHSCGLAVVAKGIQDRAGNETRFISLAANNDDDFHLPSRNDSPRACKTSLILSVGDRPGALFKVLEQFYHHGVNMNKIESRPAKTRLGCYLFFIDIDGHHTEPHIIEALRGVRDITANLRLLGSYRTYRQVPEGAGH